MLDPVSRAILTTLRDQRGENWTELKLAAQVRQGGLHEVQDALARLLGLRYVSRLSPLGSNAPCYVLQRSGETALEEE